MRIPFINEVLRSSVAALTPAPPKRVFCVATVLSRTVAIAKVTYVLANPGLDGAICEISVGDAPDWTLRIVRGTSQVSLPPLSPYRIMTPAFCFEEEYSDARYFPPSPSNGSEYKYGRSDE